MAKPNINHPGFRVIVTQKTDGQRTSTVRPVGWAWHTVQNTGFWTEDGHWEVPAFTPAESRIFRRLAEAKQDAKKQFPEICGWAPQHNGLRHVAVWPRSALTRAHTVREGNRAQQELVELLKELE